MLASPQLQPETDPPKEGQLLLDTTSEAGLSTEDNLSLASSLEASNDEYAQLQMRVFRATLVASVFAVAITAIFFDFPTAISLLVGALLGFLYLRLLARSIGKLGKSSNTVSKIQLFVPVLLVLVVSKQPQLEL